MGRYLELADQAVAKRKAPTGAAPSQAPCALSRFSNNAAAASAPGRASPQRCYEINELNEITRSASSWPVEDAQGPEEWVAGVEKLKLMRVPQSAARQYWRQIIADADRFLSRWGATAAALGWGTLDLFGVYRDRPLARYDAAGLLVVLGGSEVVALTADCAEIRTRSGALQRYHRHAFNEPGRVILWELADR